MGLRGAFAEVSVGRLPCAAQATRHSAGSKRVRLAPDLSLREDVANGERKAIEPAGWGPELGWYRQNRLSPAVQVGDLLFVSGCTGAEAAKNGARAQMRRAYEEIGEVLHAAGASWGDVVSMTTYHLHFRRDIDAMIEVHREFIAEEPFPSWTAVGVTELYEPEAIVEISVIAVVPPPDGHADSARRR